MIGYSACETALISSLITAFNPYLDTDNCKAGDIDAVMANMFSNDDKYGCVVDFAGGRHKKPETFTQPIWVWSATVALMVKVDKDTVESDIRELIDKAALTFNSNFDFRLGGAVAKAEVVLIDAPNAYTIADVPLYTLPIAIEIWDK